MKKMKFGDLIVTALAVVAAVWAVAFAVLCWFRSVGGEPYLYESPTKLGNDGRNIVSVIRQASDDRAASGAGDLWPAKGEWTSSTAYLERLCRPDLENYGLDKSDIDGPWCCLAGVGGEDDSMPFLWTANLEVTDAMLRGEDVDWGGQLRDEGPVVIVRKGGSVQFVKKKQLSAETFFNMSWGGALPRDPDALEVLKPLPAPEPTGDGHP